MSPKARSKIRPLKSAKFAANVSAHVLSAQLDFAIRYNRPRASLETRLFAALRKAGF